MTTEPGESAVYAAALNVLVVASEHLVIAGQNLPSPPARSLYSGNREFIRLTKNRRMPDRNFRDVVAGDVVALAVGVQSLPLSVQVELEVIFEVSG